MNTTSTTAAAVSRALGKAGYRRSEFHRSGMVRGYGTWTSGFRVQQYGDAVRVEHVTTQHGMPNPDTLAAVRRERLTTYAGTLTACGYAVTRSGEGYSSHLVVTKA